MDTVRIVRDLGSVRDLFPEGVDSFADMPYTLFEALRMGKAFNGFQEMLEDEAPPKNIWLNDKLLKEHFDWLKLHREKKYKGEGGGGSIHDEEIEDAVENTDAEAMLIQDG